MLLLLDANIALLVAALGVLLICAEFCLPGWVVPGVTGGVCLICGVFRLGSLEADVLCGAALGSLLVVAGISGYGLVPQWIGVGAVVVVPWLCRMLIPGSIQWHAALLAGAAPAFVFILLRVAARAAMNKTLLQ